MEPLIDAAFPALREVATEQPTAPALPFLSLGQILAGLSQLNEIMDAPNWKPEDVVGVLDSTLLCTVDEAGEQLRHAMRDKIDSIDFVVAEFEAYAERTKARAAEILKRATAAEKRAQSLLDYVKVQMESQGIEQLTGNNRVIIRQRAANPTFVESRLPTDMDMVVHGEKYVRLKPAKYEWKADPIKKDIKAGMQFDFGTTTYSHSIIRDDRDRLPPARKPKGKKK